MLVKVFAVVWMGIIIFWDVTLCDRGQHGGLTFMVLKFHENLQILENGTTTLSKHQAPYTL
jgi:hypothetical protein